MNTTTALAWLTSFALLLPSLPAQDAAATQPVDVAAIAKGLEDLSAEVDALQGRVLAALELAKAAKSPEAEEALYAEVVQLGRRIADLGAKASALRADANPLKARIEAALKQPTARESRAALQELERDTDEATRGGDEDAARLLGLVRYHVAEVMRQEAVSDGDPRSHAWNQVADQFEKVLECSDSAAPGIGPSLHAAALAMIIECKVTLYLGYEASRPQTPASMGAMKRYAREARGSFERLQRGYPDKVQGAQSSPLDVARDLMKRIR